MNLSEFNRNRIRDIEDRLVVAKGEEAGRRLVWDFETSRYKLVYIEQINNNVLQNSIRNYIQHATIIPVGKEHEKECVCIYIHIIE